jgi:hypothetical protein
MALTATHSEVFIGGMSSERATKCFGRVQQGLHRTIVCLSNMNESASSTRVEFAYARDSQNLVRIQDVPDRALTRRRNRLQID